MTDLSNWAPFQVLIGPADVYLALVGEEFPDLGDAPAGDWAQIGRTEGGVTARKTQDITAVTADQHTGPIKAARTAEGVEVEFGIVDMTLESMAYALDSLVTTAGAGADQTQEIKLHSGVAVTLYSVLVRGRSPYANAPAQYQVPVAYQQESVEVSHVKDDKSVLSTVWVALEDLSAVEDDDRFGSLIAADPVAT